MSIQMQPLFWRIGDTQGNGRGALSLLMPHHLGSRNVTELPINLSFQASPEHSGPKDLRWSESDVELFMALLQQKRQDALEGDVELDIQDRAVQGMIQLVALARFQTALNIDADLDGEIITERTELEIGSMVALNNGSTFPLAIIVALDSVEVSCILLEPCALPAQELADGSLVVLSRQATLPESFAQSFQGEGAVRH